MSLSTKIILSSLEQAKVLDAEWILTKHRILEKAQWLMQQQIEPINQSFQCLASKLDAEALSAIPKISKGENYRKLPYIILDYPAVFSKENIFALRTLFWWGNNFSVHLLLSGCYLEQFKETIFRNLKQAEPGFYICVNDTEWEHHFEPDNYILATEESIELVEEIQQNFLKIALKFNLKEWNNLTRILPEAYYKMSNLLQG